MCFISTTQKEMPFELDRMLLAASARMLYEIDLNEEEILYAIIRNALLGGCKFDWLNSPGIPRLSIFSLHLTWCDSLVLWFCIAQFQGSCSVSEDHCVHLAGGMSGRRPLLESSYQTFGYVSWPEVHYKSGTKHAAGKGDWN